MVKEPLWRTVLSWGAVITFLTLPLLVFVLSMLSDALEEHIRGLKFLAVYFQTITGLVFGLAGLNTVDKIKK